MAPEPKYRVSCPEDFSVEIGVCVHTGGIADVSQMSMDYSWTALKGS